MSQAWSFFCRLLRHRWCAGHGGGYRCCYRCGRRVAIPREEGE
jgi:hypothetical protein